MIHLTFNIRILLDRIPVLRQPIRFKLKRFGDRPPGQSLQILGQQYPTDEWTNIPDKVIELIERPDPLYITEGNPIYLIAESLRQHFTNFRCFHFRNPVVSVWQNFDSILVPHDHVSRSRSDTFYVNQKHVLRSHTSAHQSQCFRELAGTNQNTNSQDNQFIIIGDVYRRDEVNRTHHAAFHQAEIAQLYSKNHPKIAETGISSLFDECNKTRTELCQETHVLEVIKLVEKDFKSQVESYIQRMFADDQIEMRWIPAYFPFTHPSWELEIKLPDSNDNEDEWLEMLGCGIIEQQILNRDGLSNHIGWALGFGLERLAMLYYSIPDIRLFWSRDSGFLVQFEKLSPFERYRYKPISSYPQKIFDISFWLPLEEDSQKPSWSSNDVHAIILEIGGNLVEQAHLVDQWKRPSDGRQSNCYRIVYRSHERALTNDEVNQIHRQIEQTLVQELNVTIR